MNLKTGRSRAPLSFLPLGRDAHIWQTQESFNRRPFSDVIAFDTVPDELQKISNYERRRGPIPGNNKEQNDPGHREGNANHVNPKVDRMPVPLQPILDDPPQRPTAKETILSNRLMGFGHDFLAEHWKCGRIATNRLRFAAPMVDLSFRARIMLRARNDKSIAGRET
jgi:hypothetical protein